MIALVPPLRELEQMGQSGDLTGGDECHERIVAALADTRQFLVEHFPAASELEAVPA